MASLSVGFDRVKLQYAKLRTQGKTQAQARQLAVEEITRNRRMKRYSSALEKYATTLTS